MDDYTAVFNCKNSDIDFAKAEYIEAFGEESFEENIQPFIDNGIMSFFNE